MDAKEGLSTVFDKLHELLRTETVVGEAIVVGKVHIIPIISVSVGAGSGSGGGTDENGNRGDGAGGGGGGKVTPTAVIIVKDDDVSVVPLTGRGSLEKIAEMVPEILAQLQSKDKGSKKAETSEDDKDE